MRAIVAAERLETGVSAYSCKASLQAFRSRKIVEVRTKLIRRFTVGTHWREKEALRFSYSRLPRILFRTVSPLSTSALPRLGDVRVATVAVRVHAKSQYEEEAIRNRCNNRRNS